MKDDEEAFAELLEQKTNKDVLAERKTTESSLQAAIARNEEVSHLYERIYEDNVNGKISDERFMQLSHKYDTEQEELKKKIFALKEHLHELEQRKTSKDQFILAVRKFMEMQTLTPMILHELIERIEVDQIVGTGKARVQQVTIYFRFVGMIEIPDVPKTKHTLETRQGVEVTYEVA